MATPQVNPALDRWSRLRGSFQDVVNMEPYNYYELRRNLRKREQIPAWMQLEEPAPLGA
jgi:hypothetical protein